MNQLFAYESEEEQDTAQPSRSTSPASPASPATRDEEDVEQRPASRALERPSSRGPGTKPRSSRWAQTSAFLAPIAYDANDVDGSGEDEDEDEDEGARGRQPAPRAAPGMGTRDAALALKKLLPAPVHETRDRNTPVDSGAGPSEAATGAAAEAATRTNVANDAAATTQAARRTVNAAPAISATALTQGVTVPYPAPMAHGAPSQVPLPVGAVVREISAGDLRGPHGGGSLVSGQELEMAFRANAARGGAVSKLAKRKNQLSSLLSEASVTAEEHRQKRADGASVRSATRMKYGW